MQVEHRDSFVILASLRDYAVGSLSDPLTRSPVALQAVARILESDPYPDLPLTICSDSQYTIDGKSAGTE